ncbi:MAG: putative MAPEG superfamily protein [Planctomycetaceae bacterium]|jgi:uncharacterized MAPEG superfamily protein
MDIFEQFQQLTVTLGVMALLMLIQIVMADVLGILAKHVPGTPIDANHDSLLFRANRTVANTNESIAVFILAVIFCVLAGASPVHTAYAASGFVVSRVLYAIFYYANWQLLRSVVFGVSLLFLFALLLVGML